MPRPRKVPAVLIEATIRENGKLAALSSDAARLGYIYICLGAAKLVKPIPGLFASRAHFREIAGRFAPYLNRYLSTGLMEEAPNLCQRCTANWSLTPPEKGALVTHDWHQHQYDPFHAERQAAYEARKGGRKEPQSDGVSDGQSDAQSDGVSDAKLTADSRAHARSGPRDRAPNSRTLNSERTKEEGESQVPSAVPARAARGTSSKNGAATNGASLLEAWSRFAGRQWQPFIGAWRARGFRLPPGEEQRETLLEAVDARPRDVGTWVAEPPKESTSFQVVAHVLARWHAVRDEAMARAAEDDSQQAGRARRGTTTHGLEKAL